jgi:predicted PurR-regulated permease PerM
MQRTHISVSTGTIVRFFAVILGLWLLFLIRDIVALFFLSVIFTATLDPVIDRLSRKNISRSVAVFIIYILLIVGIGILMSFIVPPLVSQFQDFTRNIPTYSETMTQIFSGVQDYAKSYGIQFDSHAFLQNIFSGIFQSSGQLFSTTINVLSFFISVLVILALTFYMSVKEDSMNKFIISITPVSRKDYIVSLADRIKHKIGKWFAGQIFLMLIIFILDFVSLSVFRIPYALILALLAGILEIVPYLGPIISTVLAASIGFLISPVTGLIILGVLTIIQQLESHVIVPQVMKKAVGLNPVVVILSLLIGAELAGTLGAVLAVPIATSIGVFVDDLVQWE